MPIRPFPRPNPGPTPAPPPVDPEAAFEAAMAALDPLLQDAIHRAGLLLPVHWAAHLAVPIVARCESRVLLAVLGDDGRESVLRAARGVSILVPSPQLSVALKILAVPAPHLPEGEVQATRDRIAALVRSHPGPAAGHKLVRQTVAALAPALSAAIDRSGLNLAERLAAHATATEMAAWQIELILGRVQPAARLALREILAVAGPLAPESVRPAIQLISLLLDLPKSSYSAPVLATLRAAESG